MIFLLTQMLLCIVFALAAGAAGGWIWQRARSVAALQTLRATVAQQRMQVDQARTDVSLVTQDFDELKHRARDEIDQLRQENRRIPSLLQNLEKSQTLVRQLMQKHEAQLRDLAHAKEGLEARLAHLSDQESTWRRTADELDTVRRQLSGSSGDSAGVLVPDTRVQSTEPTAEPTAEASTGQPDADRTRHAMPQQTDTTPARNASTGGSWASARLGDVAQTDALVTARTPAERDEPTRAEVDADRSGVSDSQALMRSIGLDFAATADPAASDADRLSADAAQDDADEPLETDERSGTVATLDETAIDDDELDIDDDLDAEDDDDIEQLFDPVDRHDDLKRIFGIGPVTEQALNQLGITSYSQLAELQHHDIETIATALQIFPSRIERDDWVGNARKQLEEVLEEL